MRALLVIVCLLCGWAGFIKNGYSHAMHPDSMDRHAEFTFTPSRLILIYQVVCGLNPTESYTRRLDPDNDGTITDEERLSFVKAIAETYTKQQIIQIGGQNIPMQYHSGDAYATVGHNGMHVIKVDIAYTIAYPADMPKNATHTFSYEDNNFKAVPGWKQMQVTARDGVVYDGYVPYQEYKPFDYEIINTKGFSPSTEKLSGQVNVPHSETEMQAVSAMVSLPDRTIPQEVMRPDEKIVMMLVYGIAVIFVLIAIVIGYRVVRMNQG